MINKQKLLSDPSQPTSKVNKRRQKENKKQLDFKLIHKVKIAFRFAYIGINYKGLVTQANGEDTVEGRIIEALKKVCLIDPEAPLFEC